MKKTSFPDNQIISFSRRDFITGVSLNLGAAALVFSGMSSLTSCGGTSQEDKSAEESAAQKKQNKLGIALVGLGQYAEGQLAPALQETGHCYLAGIVTGTPEKAEKWKRKYNIPEKNIYNYQNFDTIRDNPDIDIVYIVLPNGMHADYTIRAFGAGKHVICEKPMAVTVEDCDRMIDASRKAGKMFSIGYRLHFEPYNKEMMRLGQEKVYGNLKRIIAQDGMNGTEGWRLDKELAGGGPLMDVGIYCVQAARYVAGMEPVAVTAKEHKKTDLNMFREVEEGLSWQMEFPDGLTAMCETSYSQELNLLRAEAERGWFQLRPAYAYRGISGETSDGKLEFEGVNQQALQMDDFAAAIKDNRPTPVPGEMGRQDVKILQAIYESMRTGKRVSIS